MHRSRCASRGGVVDGDAAPRGVHQLRKIARAHLRLRHGEHQRLRRTLPVAFVIEQEEGPVAAVVDLGYVDRAVELHAVLVEVVAVLGGPAGIVLERIAVQKIAAHEFVHRPVQAVAAALQRHVDDAAGALAVLRIVGVGLDLELLNRIDGRHVGDVVGAGLRVVGRAVEQELVIGVAAVDVPVGDGPVVERALVNQRAVEIHAGNQHREHERVAPVERILGDRFGVHQAAAVRRGLLEKRRLRGDRHFLRDGADLQFEIERRGLGHGQREARRAPPV